MIDSQRLLTDLTRLLTTLERDLREQLADRPELHALLQTDYDAARNVGRTQDTFETWSEEPLTQAAVAWILGTVYVRFLEDNGLIDPMLSGTEARHTRAQQEHQHYFQQHPTDSDRHYLESLFGRLAEIPAAAALFDRKHNPLWRLPLSADAARDIVEFWQRIDPDTGAVTHDFSDLALDTRFLGDLYQDLSEGVRKRYALLQTPRFVESFILDRTLTPAIETFGYREVRLIDPTCGSGHFLLGAFERLLALAQEHAPGKDVRVLVQGILSRVVGVDINPYAVAIAQFRLTVAALKACGITRLADAPGFEVSVVAADSLLHGPRFADREMGAVQASMLEGRNIQQYYFAEDETKGHALLGRQYHAVVGNPPYITVKDAAIRDLYRQRYRSCSGKYALVVPFMERFFELATQSEGSDATRAGYVGMIVANSFMKREFGKRLIEEYIPRWDLTHVVDTAGAYVPGHGTPTAILFGRHRRPEAETLRVAMGIRGEPSRPDDPAKGDVWTAIRNQIDRPGSESAYVSVADAERASFHKHPWNIGGGGAAELKILLDASGPEKLSTRVESIGFQCITGDDEFFVAPHHVWRRVGCPSRALGVGDLVRNWSIGVDEFAAFPYDSESLRVLPLDKLGEFGRFAWPYRCHLSTRLMFGRTQVEAGLEWYAYRHLAPSKLRTSLSIALAFVATHNHFALDRGGRVFNRTSPVIKLNDGATEHEHLSLLALLNCSAACFWVKQVAQNRGSTVDAAGARQRTAPFEDFWEFTSSGLTDYPVVDVGTDCAARLDTLGAQLGRGAQSGMSEEAFRMLLGAAVSAQEELDWRAYGAYGLTAGSLEYYGEAPRLQLGERAFELVMGRQMASGELETTWFERHGSTATTEPPAHWPQDYRELVERRVALIESDRNIGLVEQPEHKRRWNTVPFLEQVKRHQRERLCDRLESSDYRPAVGMTSIGRLADLARQDSQFMGVAESYADEPGFDVTQLVEDLVFQEAVPFLPMLRYQDSGMVKRAQWERTWALQRQEEAGADVGDIAVPPKYKSADFKNSTFWRLRGKLDVPKERFISYPGCERAADGSLPIAWAGWNHAEQARALGAYYMQIKSEEGTVPAKLVPLLAGLLELIPWIRQWHAGPDPEFGLELGDYYSDFVEDEARALELTVGQVRAWRPEAAPRSRRRSRRS